LSLKEIEWEDLLYAIQDKKCTPFIGAGACSPWLPLGKDIAKDWAKTDEYPLDDSYQLSRVAQFLAIKNNDYLHPKKIMRKKIGKINPPDFSLEKYRDTAFSILADLNLPIYITTNYDHFMESAFKDKGKDPVSEFCRWNNFAKAAGIQSVFDNPEYKPKESKPLVYHLHGDVDIPQSMVLTESDYIDFVVNLNQENTSSILPATIRQTLVDTTLLFIGYSLEDINFRIIFRGIMNYLGFGLAQTNVAVLLPPSNFVENKRDESQKYLEKYAENMFKVKIFWGDASIFSSELRQRWDKFKS
jgi:hypothetical protein